MAPESLFFLQLFGIGFILGALLHVGRGLRIRLAPGSRIHAFVLYGAISLLPVVMAGAINALLLVLALVNAGLLQVLREKLDSKKKNVTEMTHFVHEVFDIG